MAHAISLQSPQCGLPHASSQGLLWTRGSWVSRFARCEAGPTPAWCSAWLQPSNSSNSWQDGVRTVTWVLEVSSSLLAALGGQMPGQGELVWRRGCLLTSTSGSEKAPGKVRGALTLSSDTVFWAKAAPDMAPLWPSGQWHLTAHISATHSVPFPLSLLGWSPQLSKWLEELDRNWG